MTSVTALLTDCSFFCIDVSIFLYLPLYL